MAYIEEKCVFKKKILSQNISQLTRNLSIRHHQHYEDPCIIIFFISFNK